MTDAKIFINGFVPKALGEKDPEFVMGKGSINVDEMIKSLQEIKQYADNGWVNYQIFASKKDPSKRYAQLNLWKPSSEATQAPQTNTRFQFNKEPLPIIDRTEGLTDQQIEDLPF